MNKTMLVLLMSLGLTLVSNQAAARRGADDGVAGNVRQCRGCDDPAGHIRQGRGADDPAGHVSGRDRVRLDERGRGRGTDDPAGHVRQGRGQDHADGHVSGRDR